MEAGGAPNRSLGKPQIQDRPSRQRVTLIVVDIRGDGHSRCAVIGRSHACRQSI
jgi:hypothetical protein